MGLIAEVLARRRMMALTAWSRTSVRIPSPTPFFTSDGHIPR
eukprot:CAMPEP_0172608676 /NCGR_PEP_ID=MMETSP1068-20121228/28747_1 /TAXON_ID=35684 /ORGANISM="Pseudopedinella elastica, Strain CCMP716" /LENGTH=41 /DNA_ID= /DNA_START= /DNA_END= /DNA_ORIENTATION=